MSFRIIHGIILKLKNYQKMALEFSGRFCKKYIFGGAFFRASLVRSLFRAFLFFWSLYITN